MTQVLEVLLRLGGVASTAVLANHGVAPNSIDQAVERGRILRLRRGWVAAPGAPQQVVRAVRVGGRVSCLSVLRTLDLWCATDSRLHVRVPATSTRLSAPHDRRIPLGDPARYGIALHRSHRAELPDPEGPVDSFAWALLHSITCQSKPDAIVTLDSALAKKYITRTELEFLVVHLPAKYRAYLDLTDPKAASGLETKARLGLHRYNIPHASQVKIPGVGHVDLLVGDRLVIETDGREWHTKPEAYLEDRRRDLALIELGYLVMRLSYLQVMEEWDRIITVVRSLVAREEHRWAPHLRRAGLGAPLDLDDWPA